MPTINSAYVPTIAPGGLFSRLMTDNTLSVRWLVATDPAYYEVLNRPQADIVVRQLVIAKAVDSLQVSLGHQNLFPFLVQAQVGSGTDVVDVPTGWIWDLSLALPKKWQAVRLAKIKRIAGSTDTGYLRLFFSAIQENSTTEIIVFAADYRIDSTLTYQLSRLEVVVNTEETTAINSTESETVAGFITFRTLDVADLTVQEFLNLLAPPDDTTDSNSDGRYDNPAVYELVDTVAGGTDVTGDYAASATSHGTGLLVDSVYAPIPQLDSDIQSWIVSLNYPFDAEANRTSTVGIVIPAGLFREFDLCVPAGDEPTGDTSGSYFPVWINRIERIGTGGQQLRVYFATHNVTDTETGGTPSTETVEFASLDLLRNYIAGEIVAIVPTDDLQLVAAEDAQWQQHFGRGHVVLSSLWDKTTSEVDDWFDAFDGIADTPPDTSYTTSSTRLSAFGLSRAPKYVPTIGQARALLGSTSRRTSPIDPSYDNRYVTEQDQGLGNRIDLEAQSGINPNAAFERYGYMGSLCHRIVKLVVDATQIDSTDSAFYTNEVLPRLTILLGRPPQFGDSWHNGTRVLFFNGDSWQSYA